MQICDSRVHELIQILIWARLWGGGREREGEVGREFSLRVGRCSHKFGLKHFQFYLVRWETENSVFQNSVDLCSDVNL